MDLVEANNLINSNIETFENSTSNSTSQLILKLNNVKVPHAGFNSDVRSPSVLPEISLEEVSNHDQLNDCWIIVYDRIYDVTKFLESHPGGEDVILDYAGRDATIAFRGTGHTKAALKLLAEHVIGELPLDERIFRINSERCVQLSDIPE